MICRVFSLAVLAVATYTDIRQRRIPDWLTYSSTALGVIYWLILGNYSVLLHVAGTFALAYLLYRIGLWAGGDVKLFTALAALNPYFVTVFGYSVPFVLALFLSSLLSAFVLGFPWMLFLALRDPELRQILARDALRILVKSVVTAVSFTILGLAGIFVVLLPFPVDVFSAIALAIFRPNVSKYALYSLSLFATGLFFRILALRGRIFRKRVSVDSLREGDVPADFVTVEGRVLPFSWRTAVLAETGNLRVRLSPLRAAGLEREDIEWLKAKGIREIGVRTTTPFVPFVALGYLFILFVILYGE